MAKNSNYRKRGSKTKQNYAKGVRSEDRDIQKSKDGRDWICSEGKPTNDPAWYVNNPYLSRDVGTLYFSRPTGDPLPKTAMVINSGRRNDTFDVGILAFPSIITWGGAGYNGTSSNAAVNLTAQKLYQYVVHANSRNTTYDKKDLMLCMMAIDAIYATITEAIRAYRLIANYDPQNKYVSRLLAACHWDSHDLSQHVAEFRYAINWAISRVNKFFMPSLFDMTKAHMAAYEHIYCDRPDMKGQFILKYSPGIWIYNDENGVLEYVNSFKDTSVSDQPTLNWSGYKTVAIFQAAIRRMISSLENSQYIGVIMGDLLKAFGMENMSNYAYIGIDMPISPVYDEEFNCKLHNADIGGGLSNFFVATSCDGIADSAGMIYRDTDTVDGNLMVKSGTINGGWDVNPYMMTQLGWTKFRNENGTMLDLPAGIPLSPENVLLMSLYKQLPLWVSDSKWKLDDASTTHCCLGDYNPEFLLRAELYYDPNDLNRKETFASWEYNTVVLALLSRFATVPMIYQRVSEDVEVVDTEYLYWETNNVAPLDMSLLKRMNEVILWSLWSNSTIASSESTSRDTRA